MLDRVQSVLRDIQARGTVNLNDALRIFSDLCEDIKTDTGNTVENQPAADTEEMVTGVCRAARTISRIYAKNREAFEQPGYRLRWEKASRRLEETNRRIEEIEIEAARYRLLLEEAYAADEQLQQKREEIVKAQENLREHKQQKQGLQKQMEKVQNETAQCAGEIRCLRETELPELKGALKSAQQEYEELLKQKQTAEERIGRTKNENSEMQRELEAAGALLQSECDAVREKEKLLKEYQEQYRKRREAECAQEEEIRKALLQIQEAESRETEMTQELERLTEEIENKKREVLQMDRDAGCLREEIENLKESCRLPLARIQKKKKMLDGLLARLSEDSVFKEGWNSSETMQEAVMLKEALENCRLQAQQKTEEFRNAYGTLVRFLEEGGY